MRRFIHRNVGLFIPIGIAFVAIWLMMAAGTGIYEASVSFLIALSIGFFLITAYIALICGTIWLINKIQNLTKEP